MEVFKELIKECARKFNAVVINNSAIEFSIAFIGNFKDKDYIKAIAGASYIMVAEHPFSDANKRIASCFLISALEIGGYDLELSQYDLLELFLSAARGEISQGDFIKIIKENVHKKE